MSEGHIAADMLAPNLFPLNRTPNLSSMNESTYKTPSLSGAVPRPSNSTTVHIAVASPNLHFSLLRQGHTEAQYRGESTDLTLVSQDGGELHVHRCVILPLSPLLTSLAKEQVWCCAQPRVVLAEETLETLTAMVSLIYTGTCRLDTTTVVSWCRRHSIVLLSIFHSVTCRERMSSINLGNINILQMSPCL